MKAPPRSDVLKIIQSGQGELLDTISKLPKSLQKNSDVIIISNQEYISSSTSESFNIPPLILSCATRGKSKGNVYSIECLFLAVLRQEISYSENILTVIKNV